MAEYIPDENFTEKVMAGVERIHEGNQQQLRLTEKILAGLPARTIFSLIAIGCGIWNLLRIYLVLLTPVICK